MNDKVKQIYKENLTYSLYGIFIFVVILLITNDGGMSGLKRTFSSGSEVYQIILIILFLGGVRGFYLTQKLKK